MNEGLKLTGEQKQFLRDRVISAYPNQDELTELLLVEMEVEFHAMPKARFAHTRGNTNKLKILYLIVDFEAQGKLDQFLRTIINDRPNSPYLEEVKTKFSSICENPTTPETSNPPKEDRENILYIDLMETEGDSILLRYFQDNPDNSISTKRSPGKLKIKDFDNPSSTAKILYQWLNGSEKILEIDQERNNFVGRRRQLQNCLKALKVDKDKVGVLLHGMGGLGKSTIASRIICDRLPGYLPIIWENWGQKKENREPLNANKLLEKLSEYVYKQDDEDLEQYLEGQNLQRDLIKLFKKLSERGKLLLLILDDFEWNLESEGGSYKILPETAKVLEYQHLFSINSWLG